LFFRVKKYSVFTQMTRENIFSIERKMSNNKVKFQIIIKEISSFYSIDSCEFNLRKFNLDKAILK
ncbi:MAG: hypothetical protein AAGF26_06855, partial [Cyanobacteria bacterium P01_G01_bin.49]